MTTLITKPNIGALETDENRSESTTDLLRSLPDRLHNKFSIELQGVLNSAMTAMPEKLTTLIRQEVRASLADHRTAHFKNGVIVATLIFVLLIVAILFFMNAQTEATEKSESVIKAQAQSIQALQKQVLIGQQYHANSDAWQTLMSKATPVERQFIAENIFKRP